MTPRACSLSAHPLPLQQETLESLVAFIMPEPIGCEAYGSSEQGSESCQTAANGVAPQPATTSAVTVADDSDSRQAFFGGEINANWFHFPDGDLNQACAHALALPFHTPSIFAVLAHLRICQARPHDA
jgi:hypothetical protein